MNKCKGKNIHQFDDQVDKFHLFRNWIQLTFEHSLLLKDKMRHV